ncbi:MAG: Co2+/Mg2+ efflux protein ApaG [Sulfuricella sp.]|nr:Co2+/Mg2+ efflux protein ApaG [Sulfuricella sp.]
MAESKKYRVEVQVRTEYIPEQSDIAEDRFVFAYHIALVNSGSVAAQLVSRHWIISDANQQIQEVRGLGVIGEQPVLQPGQKFEYSSGCVIGSPIGAMRGSYQMVAEDGTHFEAPIDEFPLVMPRVLH